MGFGATIVKVCVLGVWHLGAVTAAGLAKVGHDVVGVDRSLENVRQLLAGRAPLFEPGLDEAIGSGIAAQKLRFTTNVQEAVSTAEVVWVTLDTPVDEEDRADVGFVETQVRDIFPFLRPGALVLISSQVPVGTTLELERRYREAFPNGTASFACSPENLRLGKALSIFLEPDRIVVGVRNERDREIVTALLTPLSVKIEWMTVESAEMTKHAINAFLATSVAFINEIAILSENVGADAKEVERGLKSESRIGPKAYLGPGAAMAGGTLARDLKFLAHMGRQTGCETPLVNGVLSSNQNHKSWSGRKLLERLKDLKDRKVGVLGLTYKPGTDTLRRSGAVELCLWLAAQGARVWAHDPVVKCLPDSLAEKIQLSENMDRVMDGSEALVVATEWPDYKKIQANQIVEEMKNPLVVDPNRYLFSALGLDPRLSYIAVGMPR